MDFSPAGDGRLLVSLGLLAALAAAAWLTLEPGRFRSVTLILLAFFAVRVLLARARSR